MEFFITFFDLVGEYLVQMIEESRKMGSIIGGLNSTFPILIPKENKPTFFRDYRLIYLCNLCYKLISKVIANRINPLLSSFLPTFFRDYRPIYLCNFCYKLISKVIANRIKPLLSSFLSEEPLGFFYRVEESKML